MTEIRSELQPKAGAPYAIGAREYLNRGWTSPLPVPYGSKRLTASGWTGYKGKTPDLAQVKEWLAENGQDNIALRMPQDVIGIDVDAYDRKYGDLTLDVVEMTIGPLPATWRSTSRTDDDISGIYWFRLPPEAVGLAWHDLGGDVETVSWHHRYAMVWPSIHPETGRAYGWYDENGRRVVEPPRKEDLALLPSAWVQRLLKPSHTERSEATRDTSGHRDPAYGVRSDAQAWIDRSLQDLDGLPQPWFPGAFWDQTTFNVACDLVRLANSGWTGYTLEQAEEDLHAHAPTDDEWTRHEVDTKWRSALLAVGDEARPDPITDVFEPVTAEEQGGSLFDATPVFRHIRQAAHSRGLRAPMVLQNVMARILLEVPPGWMLPPTVGAKASLNLFFASVGVSSAGKSTSTELAGELLGLVGMEQDRQILPVGTGEGMADSFLDYDNKIDGMPQLLPNPARMFTADEVETLNQLVDRNGSTLSSLLKTAGTGGTIGQANAKAGGRNRIVPRGQYRMTMMVNVQPSMAGPLLEGEKSGLPQRFLWMSAEDPDAPRSATEDFPDYPGPLNWEMPGDGDAYRLISYPEEVRLQVIQAHLDEQHRTDGGKMEGHLNLTRLKVAEIFALLHGETDISMQWWELAGRFVKESVKAIEMCKEAVAAEATQENIRRAKAAGYAQVVQQEVVQQDGFLVEKTKERIINLLDDYEGEHLTWAYLVKQMSKRQKDVADRARSALEINGVIEISPGRKGGERVTLITN